MSITLDCFTGIQRVYVRRATSSCPCLCWFILFAGSYCRNDSFRGGELVVNETAYSFLIFLQFTAFALSGSKLTERVRRKAFACLLRQELAYFDQPENNSGAICARLASDALALQDMSGTRLGMIFESFSMLVFGLALGIWFSWQLTLIAYVTLFVLFILSALEVRAEAQVRHATGIALGRASSVRSDDLVCI